MGSNPISRSIFLLFLLPLFLFSFEIKESYFFDRDKVYSNDVFPIDDKFLLFHFNNSSSKQISKIKLLKLLKENYIEANTKHSVIFFYKLSPFIVDEIKTALLQLYEKRGDIIIDEISLRPQSLKDLSSLSFLEVEVSSHNLQRASGIGKAYFGIDGKRLKSLNFSYKIIGKQKILVATKRIDRDDKLTPFNTKEKSVELSHRLFNSLDSKDLKEYEARVTIRANQVINNRRVRKAFAVKKGDRIEAKIVEDGIVLLFYLIAKENGYIGDTITLKNSSKKEFIGKIIGKKEVEIE